MRRRVCVSPRPSDPGGAYLAQIETTSDIRCSNDLELSPAISISSWSAWFVPTIRDKLHVCGDKKLAMYKIVRAEESSVRSELLVEKASLAVYAQKDNIGIALVVVRLT